MSLVGLTCFAWVCVALGGEWLGVRCMVSVLEGADEVLKSATIATLNITAMERMLDGSCLTPILHLHSARPALKGPSFCLFGTMLKNCSKAYIKPGKKVRHELKYGLTYMETEQYHIYHRDALEDESTLLALILHLRCTNLSWRV